MSGSKEQSPPAPGEISDGQGQMRFAILLLSCAGLFGVFFSYDLPSALNVQMKDELMGSSGLQPHQWNFYFSLLYSLVALPNMVLPLVLGLYVDRVGCAKLIFATSVCFMVGQVLYSYGYHVKSWSIMYGGRILFGVGSESIQVAQSCLIYRWFKGKEFAFALSLQLSVARCGSVANDLVSPAMALSHGVEGAHLLGIFTCLCSFACNLAAVILDVRNDQAERAAQQASVEEDLVREHNFDGLSRTFWYLAAFSCVIYSSILPFNNIAADFFVEKFYADIAKSEAQLRAGQSMSLLFLTSALGTPILGWLIDEVGQRSTLMLGSSVVLCATYCTIFYLPPGVSMLSLGLVYMIFASALWPAFALSVPQNRLGYAYGIAIAFQNTGLTLVPIFIGHMTLIATFRDPYYMMICFFELLSVVAMLTAYLIFATNVREKGVLDLPSEEAELVIKQQENMPFQS